MKLFYLISYIITREWNYFTSLQNVLSVHYFKPKCFNAKLRITQFSPVPPIIHRKTNIASQVLEFMVTREAGLIFQAGGLPAILSFISDNQSTTHKDILHSAMAVCVKYSLVCWYV